MKWSHKRETEEIEYWKKRNAEMKFEWLDREQYGMSIKCPKCGNKQLHNLAVDRCNICPLAYQYQLQGRRLEELRIESAKQHNQIMERDRWEVSVPVYKWDDSEGKWNLKMSGILRAPNEGGKNND